MIDSLVLLLNIIVNEYLLSSYCIVIITDNVTDVFVTNIVPNFQYYFSDDQEQLQQFILKSLDSGCSDFIVDLKNPEIFIEAFEESIHVTNQRRGDRKIIFAPKEESDDDTNELIKLLDLPALEFIPDVLLILPDENKNSKENRASECSSYELVTQKFFGFDENNKTILLDKWDCERQSFELNYTLFPDKISDMGGKAVKMATFNYKPYSILELDGNGNVIGLDGTEMRTALEFCKWSNCSIQIIRDDVHEWGEIYENRTGNGIIGNVATDRADIGYGALYSWYHEYQFLDFTMPVVRTGITCIAPAPKLVARWLLPLLPFNSVTWGCVIVSLIICSVAFYITANSGNKSFSIVKSLLSSYGIIMLQGQPIREPPPSLRHVINYIFIFSLVLTNTYSSGLSSSMTVPKYESPINTVQQLVDSKLNWGATHDAWIFSILSATEPNMIHLVKYFEKLPFDLLTLRGKTEDFAFSVERLPAGHFAIGEYVTEEAVSHLQLMTQDIYWEQCVLMARKSSPFTKRLNKFIGRLHQAGLLHAWETQVVLKYSNFAVQLGVRISPLRLFSSREPRPLATQHLQGPLMLCVLGSFIATLTFIGELCIRRKRTKQIRVL